MTTSIAANGSSFTIGPFDTLELTGPSAATVTFGGQDATLLLDDATGFTGTIANFVPTDMIDIGTGVAVSSVGVVGSVLDIYGYGNTPPLSFPLSGDYEADNFYVLTQYGTNQKLLQAVAVQQPWAAGSLLFSGLVADPDAVSLGGESARIYYTNEPSGPPTTGFFTSQLYAAITTDGGKTWASEPVTISGSTVVGPSALQLANGSWRLYFQGANGQIDSASSADGLNWTAESGIRITPAATSTTPAFDNINGASVVQLQNGSYLMAYQGQMAGAYPGDPFGGTSPQENLICWATSPDGLTWTVQGIAVDSRNNLFLGELDHPRLAIDNQGQVHLYFFSATVGGLLDVAFTGNGFSSALTEDLVSVTANPSGIGVSPGIFNDPTLVNIGGTWHLYYDDNGINQAVSTASNTLNTVLDLQGLPANLSISAYQATASFTNASGGISFLDNGVITANPTVNSYKLANGGNSFSLTGLNSGVYSITGGTGDDIFKINHADPAAGSMINGDGGADRIIFSGSSAQYAVVHDSLSTITVTDSVAGRDGTIEASAISDLQFSDTSVTVGDKAASVVQGFQSQQVTAPVAVADSAANVSANLDGIQAVAAAGDLATVVLTDGGIPSLTMTSSQARSDGAAINDIAGNFSVTETAQGNNAIISGVPDALGNVAVFSGPASQYTVTPAGDGVNFTVSSSGGTDHLSNIQAVHFSDVTEIVAPTPGSNGVVTGGNVTELYGAVFGRVPDVAGLDYYEKELAANPTLSLNTLATDFLSSPEYTENPAHGYAQSSAGDTQFITDSYNNLLHRAPESGAIPYYQNLIDQFTQGLTPGSAAYSAAELAAHATLLVDFSASAEFLADVEITATKPASGGFTGHWLVLN